MKIDFTLKSAEDVIEKAKERFKTSRDLNFELDLSRLNPIDASKIALTLSAELIKQNTKARINCLVKDRETFNIISTRKLKNTFLSATLNEKKAKNFSFNSFRERKRHIK